MVWRCSISLVLLLYICGSLLETSGQRVRQKLQRRKSVDYFYEKPSYDFEVEDSKSKESDKTDDYKTKKTDYVPDFVKSAKKIVSKEKSTESTGVCDTLTCPVGRVCVPGGEGQATCVCGGEDVCVGHKKRVCGTDGVWYPSHCELHRIACVQARHIGVDRDGKNCRSKHDAPVKGKSKVNVKAKQPTVHKPSNVKVEVSEKAAPKVKDTPIRQPCTRVEYEQFKASLLKYHCVRTTAADCTTSASRGRQAVSDMLAYYDTRKDNVLDADELMALEHRDHVQRLSRVCHLGDLITFDDIDFDGSLTPDEFNRAFSSQLTESSKSAPIHFNTVTTAGGSLEIKCDPKLVKVGWRRGQYSLPDIHADAQIRIVADGSLYFGRVGPEHAGNYSCYDLVTGVTSQLHILKVYSAPIVHVTPSSQFHREGSTVTIHCHATALPQAQLSWTVNGRPVSPDNKHYRLMGHNSTLEVASAEFAQDSGTFTCQASNSVGSGQATARVFVDNVEADKHGDGVISREQFLVFHRDGYTVYDPLRCLLKHTVSASFSRLPLPVTGGSRVLCEGGKCEWSGAVNVRDRLVYVAQPTLNRVLVLDMDELGNVLEVIATDKAPSSVQYVAHLDQVWVTCDTSDKRAGDSYVAMVIRAASDVSGPHQVVHTEPVGGHYDMIKKMFVPEQSEIGIQWRHAYVLHDGQQGLSKLSLDTLKYTADIELKSLDCVPRDVTFLPIGGHVAVNCVTKGGEEKSPLVIIDALTDTIVSHTVPSGRPYMSPDGRRFVVVRDADNSITVSRVDDTGAMEQQFVTHADFKVAKVTFIASSSGQGYDMYATSATSGAILSVNLSTGHANTITSTGGEKQLRALVGGGELAEFVMVSTSRGVMAVNGRQQRVQCRWNELLDADVIVWSEDRLFA